MEKKDPIEKWEFGLGGKHSYVVLSLCVVR